MGTVELKLDWCAPVNLIRRKVEALETELAELDRRQAEETAALEDEAKALARRQTALEKRHKADRDRLRDRLRAARDKV